MNNIVTLSRLEFLSNSKCVTVFGIIFMIYCVYIFVIFFYVLRDIDFILLYLHCEWSVEPLCVLINENDVVLRKECSRRWEDL